jgi:hypothetical protein
MIKVIFNNDSVDDVDGGTNGFWLNLQIFNEFIVFLEKSTVVVEINEFVFVTIGG